MATNGGSKMFLIIGGLIVVAGGIGAYFLLRKPKEEEGDSKPKDEEDEDKKPVGSVSGSVSGSGSGSVSATYTAPAELNTTDKIKAFQDWMDKEGKGWVLKNGKYILLNKGEGYGNYGKNTDAVWKVYGKNYLKSVKESENTNTNTNTNTTALSKDINTIIKSSTGTKADKTYLSKANADFVSDWAKAVTNKKRTFLWANQFYRTKTGDRILDYNPIGKVHYASKTGKFAKYEANNNATAISITKGTELGKAGGVDFDGKYVFIYFPEREGYSKWLYSSAITSKKPSSSFMGSDMDLDMFASFDNNLDLNL